MSSLSNAHTKYIGTVLSFSAYYTEKSITATDERIVELVQEKTSAKNRSEEEIMGYRSILYAQWHDELVSEMKIPT